ncbi:MAG: ATP-binding cassette domain-containing protein [Elusimicrobia bacterium]|nr:ATP-binding cassette domain-containing protein [Elusimicrobiota bacterium]
MILAKNLTKRFGDRTAVDHVSFDIPQGPVVGFLGPNGAGKTTTMRLLTAYLPADEGHAELAGLSVCDQPLAVRRRLGYLPEDNPLWEDLELTEALHFAGRLRGLSDDASRAARVKAVVKSCGLRREVGTKVGELSKGFRQRLGLAAAIIHDPEILILDEPTTGLDPNQVLEVRGLISELRARKTVLISTHILPEVTATCDRVIIINAGKIVADGTPAELAGDMADKNRLHVELKGPQDDILQALTQVAGASHVAGEPGGSFIVESAAGADLREQVFRLAVSHDWPILSLRQERLSLEEIFRALTLDQ